MSNCFEKFPVFCFLLRTGKELGSPVPSSIWEEM